MDERTQDLTDQTREIYRELLLRRMEDAPVVTDELTGLRVGGPKVEAAERAGLWVAAALIATRSDG